MSNRNPRMNYVGQRLPTVDEQIRDSEPTNDKALIEAIEKLPDASRIQYRDTSTPYGWWGARLTTDDLKRLVSRLQEAEKEVAEYKAMCDAATMIEFDKQGEPRIEIWKIVRHSKPEWAVRGDGSSSRPSHLDALSAYKSLQENNDG